MGGFTFRKSGVVHPAVPSSIFVLEDFLRLIGEFRSVQAPLNMPSDGVGVIECSKRIPEHTEFGLLQAQTDVVGKA